MKDRDRGTDSARDDREGGTHRKEGVRHGGTAILKLVLSHWQPEPDIVQRICKKIGQIRAAAWVAAAAAGEAQHQCRRNAKQQPLFTVEVLRVLLSGNPRAAPKGYHPVGTGARKPRMQQVALAPGGHSCNMLPLFHGQ